MTIHTADTSVFAPVADRGIAKISAAVTGPFKAGVRALRRQRTERELNRLDARLLADIGIERGDIGQIASELAARGSYWR